VAVETANVPTRNSREDFADVAPSHQFSLFDRLLNSGDRGVDVDDDALAKPARRRRPRADDVESIFGHVADQRTDLRRPDVEPRYDVAVLRHLNLHRRPT